MTVINTSAESIYGGPYVALSEAGRYWVVVYARDNDGVVSRPKEVTIGEPIGAIYLPLILK